MTAARVQVAAGRCRASACAGCRGARARATGGCQLSRRQLQGVTLASCCTATRQVLIVRCCAAHSCRVLCLMAAEAAAGAAAAPAVWPFPLYDLRSGCALSQWIISAIAGNNYEDPHDSNCARPAETLLRVSAPWFQKADLLACWNCIKKVCDAVGIKGGLWDCNCHQHHISKHYTFNSASGMLTVLCCPGEKCRAQYPVLPAWSLYESEARVASGYVRPVQVPAAAAHAATEPIALVQLLPAGVVQGSVKRVAPKQIDSVLLQQLVRVNGLTFVPVRLEEEPQVDAPPGGEQPPQHPGWRVRLEADTLQWRSNENAESRRAAQLAEAEQAVKDTEATLGQLREALPRSEARFQQLLSEAGQNDADLNEIGAVAFERKRIGDEITAQEKRMGERKTRLKELQNGVAESVFDLHTITPSLDLRVGWNQLPDGQVVHVLLREQVHQVQPVQFQKESH